MIISNGMDRKKLFKTFAYFIILLFLLNYVATKLYWYFSIWWSDIPMHFLGGFCIGLAFIWFLSSASESFRLSLESKALTRILIFKIILGVLLVGIFWEVFEIYFINYIAQNSFNAPDTISDIFFDLAGGIFSIFYFLKTTSIKENKL